METIITIENAFIVMAIIGAFLILRLCISINFLPPIEEAIKEAIDGEEQETIDEEEQETIDEEEQETIDEEEQETIDGEEQETIDEEEQEAIDEEGQETIDEEGQETIDEEEQETIDEEEIKTKVIMTYIAYHNIILLGFLLILPLATYNVIKSHNWLSWLGFCITFLVGLNSSLKINNLFLLYSEKYTN